MTVLYKIGILKEGACDKKWESVEVLATNGNK